jgi:SAM-dependent methyltransferase
LSDQPAAFFRQHRSQLLETGSIGRVLDLACGRGRHSLAAASAGLDVLAIDRNQDALAALDQAARDDGHRHIETRLVDLEQADRPDLGAERFGAILVFRYLHRPLAPWIAERLAAGGILLYETFTTDQRALAWGPSRPAFLLDPGELPTLFPTLEVLSYEEGPSEDPRPAQTGRLLARQR